MQCRWETASKYIVGTLRFYVIKLRFGRLVCSNLIESFESLVYQKSNYKIRISYDKI